MKKIRSPPSSYLFLTCKSSYDKLRYTYKQEVAINKLLLKDLTSTIYSEIDQLNSTDRKIAILFFIYEYNISEISRILDLPRKTVTYRKNKIQKHLQKVVKDFCHFDD